MPPRRDSTNAPNPAPSPDFKKPRLVPLPLLMSPTLPGPDGSCVGVAFAFVNRHGAPAATMLEGAPMIIDGKAIAAKVRAEVAQAVKDIQQRAGVTPGLALIRVGNDPASEVYVRGKAKACQETGMAGFEHILPEQTSEGELLTLVRELKVNPHVHGVLGQVPPPRHISADEGLAALAPLEDVGGVGP